MADGSGTETKAWPIEAADLFVASDYAYAKELASALEREQRLEVRIAHQSEAVDVTPTPIAAFQVPLDLQTAVTSYYGPHEAWAAIAVKLREVVVELRAGSGGKRLSVGPGP